MAKKTTISGVPDLSKIKNITKANLVKVQDIFLNYTSRKGVEELNVAIFAECITLLAKGLKEAPVVKKQKSVDDNFENGYYKALVFLKIEDEERHKIEAEFEEAATRIAMQNCKTPSEAKELEKQLYSSMDGALASILGHPQNFDQFYDDIFEEELGKLPNKEEIKKKLEEFRGTHMQEYDYYHRDTCQKDFYTDLCNIVKMSLELGTEDLSKN